jgi:hypothetical protein
MKGLACLGDISIKHIGEGKYVLENSSSMGILCPVEFFIRDPEDDDAECVFEG